MMILYQSRGNMKNSLISLVLAVIITSLPASGEILHASVEYNAEMARKAAFENVVYQIPASKIQSHLFDKDIEENKNAMKYNLKLPDREVILYKLPFSKAYGVNMKKEKGTTYFYWHSSGYLKAVAIETVPKNGEKYPFAIYRYNPGGELTAVSFQVLPHEEYIYNKDGSLNCHWVGNTAYDKDGKVIGKAEEIKQQED